MLPKGNFDRSWSHTFSKGIAQRQTDRQISRNLSSLNYAIVRNVQILTGLNNSSSMNNDNDTFIQCTCICHTHLGRRQSWVSTATFLLLFSVGYHILKTKINLLLWLNIFLRGNSRKIMFLNKHIANSYSLQLR